MKTMRLRFGIASLCAGLLLVLTLIRPAQASLLPKSANVPGGVALVPLGPTTSGDRPPRAWWGEQRILVAADAGQWIAVVGLPLDTTPGSYELSVEADSERRRDAPFTVRAKDYPEQRITLKDSSKVQLSASDLERVTSEIAAIGEIRRNWREAGDTDTSFLVPAQGRLTGRFGLRRFFNGEARSPHAGFDIAAARGSVVRASAQGMVLATSDYFFNGKTVFVDHGNGLISMYCHLDRIDVQTGEAVKKGEPLGLSGMTGRATGPHLHWSVILNGAMVDPQLFVANSGKMQ